MGKPHEDLPELIDIARWLEDLGRERRQAMPQTDALTKVSYGHKLWQLTRKATVVLDLFKEALRQEGLQLNHGEQGSVEIKAGDGVVCTVVIPKPGLTLKSGVDIPQLKEDLGVILFEYLFEGTVTYKPRENLKQKVAIMVGEELHASSTVQAVLEAVTVTAGTPKIYFKGD